MLRPLLRQSLFLVIFTLGASALVQASESLVTSIHDVMRSKNIGEPHRVMSITDGMIYRLDPKHKLATQWLKTLKKSIDKERMIQINYELKDERRWISKIVLTKKSSPTKILPAEEKNHLENFSFSSISSYRPTVFGENDLKKIQDLFENLDGSLRKRSQCFQRAHLWAHSMYMEENVYSMKVFIFYSRQYIRRYDFDWWFHVAPFVYKKSATQGAPLEEYVLDKTFRWEQGAEPMQNWVDGFTEERVAETQQSSRCTLMDKMSDYKENSATEWCYLAKVPMYFYQPLDFENMEKTGEYDRSFDSNKLKLAKTARRFFKR